MTKIIQENERIRQRDDGEEEINGGEDRSFASESAPWVGAELAWRNRFLPPPHEDIDQYPSVVEHDVPSDEPPPPMTEVEFETILSSLAPPPVRALVPQSSASRWPTSPLNVLSYVIVVAVAMLFGWVIVDTPGATDTRGAVEIRPLSGADAKSRLFTSDATFIDNRVVDEVRRDDAASVSKEKSEAETVMPLLPLQALSDADVATTMTNLDPKIKRCRKRLSGPVTVELRISGNTGRVVSAELLEYEKVGGAAARCVAKVLRRARFPRFASGHTTIQYTFQL